MHRSTLDRTWWSAEPPMAGPSHGRTMQGSPAMNSSSRRPLRRGTPAGDREQGIQSERRARSVAGCRQHARTARAHG